MANLKPKPISFDDIEELAQDIRTIVIDKGYEIFDDGDFLTRMEKLLNDEIIKYDE